MEQEKFEEYLSDRYYDQINWYQAKASLNKRRYQTFQWAVIILAAIVPVLVAASTQINDPHDKMYVNLATIICSVLLGIGTAGIKAFKFQENWINYRSTSERLIQEKYYYDGIIGEYGDTDNKEQLFVKRVEAIFSGEGSQWVTTQKTQTEA